MRRAYLEIVTGRRGGFLAGLARGAFSVASVGYALAHGLHRLLYDLRLRRAVRLPVPVVSVGNLTVGGTGKTPFVENLARRLARKNLRVLVLARGYGSMGTGRDDEELPADPALELVHRRTGADRAAVARAALPELRPDVVILDDGFQHYRISRDLEIVLVDATHPFGGGRLLPAGLLRDRPSALRRAHLIVLTRCDQASPAELSAIRERVDRLSEGRPVIETVHKPVGVRTLYNGKRTGLSWLHGRRIYGFCGLGHPDAFRRTLLSAGAEVVKFVPFPDHHAYTELEHRRLNADAQEFMADALVTTEKDAAKLDADAFSLPLAALRVEMDVLRGDDRLDAALAALTGPAAPVHAESAR